MFAQDQSLPTFATRLRDILAARHQPSEEPQSQAQEDFTAGQLPFTFKTLETGDGIRLSFPREKQFTHTALHESGDDMFLGALGLSFLYCVLVRKKSKLHCVFQVELDEVAQNLSPNCLHLGRVRVGEGRAQLMAVIGCDSGKIVLVSIREEHTFLAALKLSTEHISHISDVPGQINYRLCAAASLQLFLVNVYLNQLVLSLLPGQPPPGATLSCAFSQSAKTALAFHTDGSICLFPLSLEVFKALNQPIGRPLSYSNCVYFKSPFKEGLRGACVVGELIWGIQPDHVLKCVVLQSEVQEQFVVLYRVEVRPMLEWVGNYSSVVRMQSLEEGGVLLVTECNSAIVVRHGKGPVFLKGRGNRGAVWLGRRLDVLGLLYGNMVKLDLDWSL